MTLEVSEESNPTLHSSSFDECTERGRIRARPDSDSTDVVHAPVTEGHNDNQCEDFTSLQPLSPLSYPVTPPQSQTEIDHIRPFPMLEFLESYELSILIAQLQDSDDGT